MEKEFNKLIEKYRNKSNFSSSLWNIQKVIEEIQKDLEMKQTNKFSQEIFEEIVESKEFSSNEETELLKLAEIIECVNDECETYDYLVNWETEYKINDVQFSASYRGTDEGDGVSYLTFGNFLTYKKEFMKEGKFVKFDLEKLNDFYEDLNLKHVSLLKLFDVLISFICNGSISGGEYNCYLDDLDFDIEKLRKKMENERRRSPSPPSLPRVSSLRASSKTVKRWRFVDSDSDSDN